MTPRLRRSFIVRVEPHQPQPPAPALSEAGRHFVVQDLKTGEQREFGDWEELRAFIERLWMPQLR